MIDEAIDVTPGRILQIFKGSQHLRIKGSTQDRGTKKYVGLMEDPETVGQKGA